MPVPFLFHELFEPQARLHAETMHIAGMGDIVIIDDFYRAPHAICDMLAGTPAPPWKLAPGSRNFQDYHDCRLTLSAHRKLYDKRDLLGQILLRQTIQAKLGLSISPRRHDFSFNLFQWINPPAQAYQHYPHHDGPDKVAAIIYLNPEADSNGGTAFYRNDPAGLTDRIGYSEEADIKVDVGKHCEIATVVPALFNRCILFPGWFLHGGYMENHDFYTGERWRINQVYFFDIAQ